jgi:D-cysteine desulfhydrase
MRATEAVYWNRCRNFRRSQSLFVTEIVYGCWVFAPPVSRSVPLIFDAVPSLRGAVPWRPLCHVPTAVEHSSALGSVLHHGGVWSKREDLISPVYSGNKVRRYEFVLAAAQARGATRIDTIGGIASTQVMATSLFGQALGIPVRAVLFDQPITSFARDALLTNVTANAEIIYGGGYITTAFRAWRGYRQNPKSYFLAPGASTSLANLGYIDAMLELDAQVRAGLMPRPDVMLVPTGSAGTLVALSLASAWLGWDTEILGVRITSRLVCNRYMVGRVLRATTRFLSRYDKRFGSLNPHFRLVHDVIGPGYGYPSPEAMEGIKLHQTLTGQPGEVTYSGKCLAALKNLTRNPAYAHKTILLWNTLSSIRPPHAHDARQRIPREFEHVFVGDVAV